jgi:hypothetical protein
LFLETGFSKRNQVVTYLYVGLDGQTISGWVKFELIFMLYYVPHIKTIQVVGHTFPPIGELFTRCIQNQGFLYVSTWCHFY